MTLNNFDPENYSPNYWVEANGLPAPTGLFGQQIAKDKPTAVQKEEAEKLLTYITSSPRTYDDLAATGLPFPMLIKVPHTHYVRFITGLAPLIKDPFSQPDNLHGELFAIMQDIDRVDQSPQVIRLPKSALKVQDIMLPTDEQWLEKITKKEDATDGKVWFKETAVKTNTEALAMVCPFLPLWGYDAFTEDVPAHVLWERVLAADEENCEKVGTYAKNWLKAVHTAHNATNIRKIEIDSRFFMERQNATSSEWVRKRVATLYPSVGSAFVQPSGNTPGVLNQNLGTNNALAILAQALARQANPQVATTGTAAGTTPTSATYDKFGMSDDDLDRMCVMCGLRQGQHAGLPNWFEKINEKGSTKDGQRTRLRKMFTDNLKYEEHPIPCTPAVLDMIMKKAFTGDGDHQTTTGVMKGLSPFLFAPQTAEDIAEATMFATAVETSTSTTVTDLQKLSKKAKAPQSIAALIALLKTFANVLEKLFSAGCPLLLRLVKDAIIPLIQLPPLARSVYSKESIAAIAWAVYHQSMFFAQGDMIGTTPLTPEWVQMANAVKGGGRSLENYSIPLALANRSPASPATKRKEDDDSPGKDPTGGSPKKRTKADKDKDKDRGKDQNGKKKGTTMELHPAIKAKVAAVLPQYWSIKKLCAICDITEQRSLFGSNICAFAALCGNCPFFKCRSDHDGSRVTDEIAEAAIQKLQPFLRNPALLTEDSNDIMMTCLDTTNALPDEPAVMLATPTQTQPAPSPTPSPNPSPSKAAQVVIKEATTSIITSHHEADTAAHHAIEGRIKHLPNVQERKGEIGKFIALPPRPPPFKDRPLPPSTPDTTNHKGLMWPTGPAMSHPAASLLDDYSTQGCPVDCGPDWNQEQILAALAYGSHPSAKIPAALKCLIKEAEAKVENGFASIVTWGDIKHNIPKKLKISPVAMIPHKSRAFRGILDLSFHVRALQHKYKSVNETTTKLAIQDAMNELGAALRRIIAAVADGQQKGKTFMFSKLDIKDGFWRMVVSAADAWNFCYIIPSVDPSDTLDDTRIVVPNALQMGWCESPPFFCAASETARDIIASLLHTDLPPHAFESKMLPRNFTSLPLADLSSVITLIEVFVDDFIACTDSMARDTILKITRAMLHGIHSIFPPRDVTGHNGGDPISEKKLDKLEGLWQHTKEILGWIIDGANYTIKLPPAKVEKMVHTIKSFSKKQKIRLKDFQKIAGSLHHASMGIPGGRGLFTTIWQAMATNRGGWIKLTPQLKATFSDFKWLFQEIANHPINVAQLVPRLPHIQGFTDACKHGAGGVWIIPLANFTNRNVYWSVDFPPSIISQFDADLLSINDLEMAGVLLGWLALEHLLPSLQHAQAGLQCDNSSTVSWTKKFTARSFRAGHLLRALALRQQLCRSAPLLVISIAGLDNDMADVASRYSSDKKLQYRSPSLHDHFNTFFQQTDSWEAFHFPQKLTSLVMSSLLGTRLTLESWRRLPGLVKSTGSTGLVTQKASASTRYSKIPILSSETSSSQLSLRGSGRVTTAAEMKLEFQASLKRFRPSARQSNWLATKAPSTDLQTSTISRSNDS